MFDMKQIGKKITDLRKANNMTQMELADKLGISFQAVSNWERGNTMPDISKLPELAEIFHISVDTLLNRKAPLVEAVLNDTVDKYMEEGNVTEQEIADTLPLLKPNQAEELVEKVDITSFVNLSSLIPFMDEDTLRDIAMELVDRGDDVNEFLPHMDDADVASLAIKLMNRGDSVSECLPFMDDADVKTLAMQALNRDDSIDEFLPFMDDYDIEQLADELIKKGDSVSQCFPFLDEEAVTKISYKLLERNDSISECLPFMEEDAIAKLAYKAVDHGYSFDEFLPFMEEEEIARLALKILRSKKK